MSMENPLNGTGLAYFWSKIKALLNNKVDKVSGKGLSTNDYTTAEKTKLAGIAAGAQVNAVTGVKGVAESSYRTGNVNLTAANVGAAAATHSHSTQQLTRPTGLRGVGDVTLQTLISSVRANRLAFLPADQIIIEQTVDGGQTWVDAGISDAIKLALFSETRPGGINLPQIDGKKNLLCGLRITITAMKYDVPAGTPETEKYQYWNANHVVRAERYCQLKDIYFWLSASNDTIGVRVERATGAKPDNWVSLFNDAAFYMNGWSGADYISFAKGVFGGTITQTGNYWNYRFTLMTRGKDGTTVMNTGYEAQFQSLSEIRGYGDSVWTAPYEYMKSDKLYSIDANQNASFPAALKINGGRPVGYFPANPTSGQIVVTDGTEGGIRSSGFTIAKSVPSNAVFTDTTYTPASAAPLALGAAAVGSSVKYAREDHVHPKPSLSDLGAASASDLAALAARVTALETALTGKADADHTHEIKWNIETGNG